MISSSRQLKDNVRNISDGNSNKATKLIHALYSQMEAADWERIRKQLQEDLKNYYSEMGGV